MAADESHKAEHGPYRELAVVLRQMLEHWGQLGRWLPASHGAAEMSAGADVTRRLLADLETAAGGGSTLNYYFLGLTRSPYEGRLMRSWEREHVTITRAGSLTSWFDDPLSARMTVDVKLS